MKYLLILGIVCLTLHASHSTPDFCQLEPDEGVGNKMIHKVYYDKDRDQCRFFAYAGEKGNENRFDHERQCIKTCSPNAESIYPMDARTACSFKKEVGSCQEKSVRYYYDAVHMKCKSFFWTGCFGNGNRFIDDQTCNATCHGIHVEGDEPEEDELDTPIGIICGVLLGLIAVGIIITVTVLTLRSKKKKPKKTKGKNKDGQTDRPLQSSAPTEIEMA